MKIKILASGSSGNCYLITGYKEKILLEVGISYDKIMEGIDFDIENLFCLVSHEHKDHSKAIKEVVGIGIDVYLSNGTAEALGLGNAYNIHKVKHLQSIELDEFVITPFNVFHDVKEPLGFIIKSNIEKKAILFATDTKDLPYQFTDIDAYMLEVNFDDDTMNENIESGKTIPFVGNRSRRSHLSLSKAIKILNKSTSYQKKIIPIHQSQSNLDFKLMEKEISKIGEFIDIRKQKEIEI